jgi:hypothetical protein
MSEVGIPYDLNKAAFSTGDYSDQTRALDANIYGLEGALMNYTLWVYTACNSHQKGDNWNGEDLSIYSQDDVRKAALKGQAADGIRAKEAVLRPCPLAVSGEILAYGFDMPKATFTLRISANPKIAGVHPTRIFVPHEWYPPERTAISTTSGTWTMKEDVLEWKHYGGSQTIVIKGEPKPYKESPCRVV